ncbi:MAG: hypothetical protein ACOC10_07205 [Bacteroidota bacterium]
MDNKPAKQERGIMQMISEDASTREITRKFANLTPAKVLRGNYPSMVRLKITQGEETTEKAIAVVIGEAAVAFGEKMDWEVALNLAAEIQTEYYFMSLEDCYIVMNRLKRQPLYGKLTLNKILTAFEQYKQERIKTASEMNYNHHLAEKENPQAADREVSMLNSPVNPGRKKKSK